jgi:hypothetical protein
MKSLMERVDDAFSVWGRAAPPMRADETNSRYIKRIARVAQKGKYLSYDEPTKRIDFDQLANDALPVFTGMLLEGIKRRVNRSDTVPDGEERAVFTRDDQTGQQTRSFVRPNGRTFCDQFMGRIQRVTRIAAPEMRTLYDAKRETAGLW